MVGAIHHPLGDQRTTHRTERRHFAAELFGDVAGTVRPGSEFRHCPERFSSIYSEFMPLYVFWRNSLIWSNLSWGSAIAGKRWLRPLPGKTGEKGGRRPFRGP